MIGAAGANGTLAAFSLAGEMGVERPVIDPTKAKSTLLRGGHVLQVQVPYRGEISMRARREASGLLRARLVGDGGAVRSVALLLDPPQLVATVAGERDAVAELQSGVLARAVAACVADALEELAGDSGAESRLDRLHEPAQAARRLPEWWQTRRSRRLRA